MREILFRGKRVDNGEWIEGFYYKEPAPPSCFSVGDDTHWIVFVDPTFLPDWGLPYRMVRVDVSPDTVGQYTGLTDKNGKKIFEGDIVKHYNNSDDVFDIGALYWDEVFSQWKRTSIGNFHHRSFTYVMSRSCEYEVIGNIHDNPELLKGGE